MRSGDDSIPSLSLVDGFVDFVRIGSGGFSSVYSARQVRMGRPVAIKVLDADLSADADRRVFERECQAMGVLSRHPNIATVYSEAYTTDGRPCLVMELYHGNYRDRLDQSGPLALGEFLALGVKIAGALQAAHDTGILHRDIKPHNIFLSDFGEPALGDFGISTIEGERSITGAAALSVAYSAPEVIDDGDADFLSDVFSLVATLHHLLAGTSPFAASQLGGVVKRILSDEPDPVDRTDVPDSLVVLLRAGLEKNPANRPDSAGDLAWSLQEIQAELGFDRTAVPLRRSDRLDPDVGADWANSSGESSARRRATMKAASEAAASERTILPAADAEATILPTDSPPRAETAAQQKRPSDDGPRAPDPSHDGRLLPGETELTIRRRSSAFDELDAAAESEKASATEATRSSRGGRWGVDVVIVIIVVALLAFALSRML